MARYLYVGCPQTHKDLLTFGSRVLELRCIPSCLACEFLSKPFFFLFSKAEWMSDLLLNVIWWGIRQHCGNHQECGDYLLSRGTWLQIVLPWPLAGMSHFSAPMSTNQSALNSVKPHYFEMWIFWWPENLTLVLFRASIMFFTLQLDVGGHDDLANVNPGHCALGLPKGTCINV